MKKKKMLLGVSFSSLGLTGGRGERSHLDNNQTRNKPNQVLDTPAVRGETGAPTRVDEVRGEIIVQGRAVKVLAVDSCGGEVHTPDAEVEEGEEEEGRDGFEEEG